MEKTIDAQIITVDEKNTAPMIRESVDQYNMMVQFVQTVMRENIDFGIIPGTGQKATLLKPGAEKLQRLFKFSSEIEAVETIEDWEKGFFYYRYKCKILHGEDIIAECEGSTNSKEKKYRYRYVFDNKATEEQKANGELIERKGKNGAYRQYRIENDEIFDLVNTLQKMAQKRAYVGAILLAANASEFFTQDIEDMGIIDAEFIDHPVSKKATSTTSKPKTIASKRPYDPETLKERLSTFAKKHEGETVSEGQRGLVVGLLNICYAGDGADMKRHEALQYLTGKPSSKNLTPELVLALLDWLHATQDNGGAWIPDQMAVREAQTLLTAARKEAGQMMIGE